MFRGRALNAGFTTMNETLVANKTPSTLALFAIKLCFLRNSWNSFKRQLSLTSRITFKNILSVTYAKRPSNTLIYKSCLGILQNLNFTGDFATMYFFDTPCIVTGKNNL